MAPTNDPATLAHDTEAKQQSKRERKTRGSRSVSKQNPQIVEQKTVPGETKNESVIETPQNGAKNGEISIAVIGDAYRQFLVLPDKMSTNEKRTPKGLWLTAGASRMKELIEKVCENVPVFPLYIPHEKAEEQTVATGLLEKYEQEKDSAEILAKLNINKEKRLRMIRPLGHSTYKKSNVVRSTETVETEENDAKKVRENERINFLERSDYWVVNDDHYSDDYDSDTREHRKKERNAIVKAMRECVECGELPKWILWHPHRLGAKDTELAEKGDFKSFFKNFLETPEARGKNDEKAKKILADIQKVKERTVVFLRADDLADDGIGQRGDSSNEECLEGIIDAIENDDDMQSLEGFAAIVIENGVDSAFLVQFDRNTSSEIVINHCQSFHRIRRTPNAYQQTMGYMSGIGAFMVASCLKKLLKIDKNDWSCQLQECTDPGASCASKPQSQCEKKLFYCLSEGIRDSLVRLLLHFHVGYKATGTDESTEKTQEMSNEEIITAIYKDIYEPTSYESSKEGKKSKHPNVTDIFVERFDTKKIGAYRLRCGNKNETNVATYVSRFFRYSAHTLEFLPPSLLEKQWSGLIDKQAKINRFTKVEDLATDDYKLEYTNDLLEAIVLFGLKNLRTHHVIGFPYASFGNFNIVDPEEISMYRRLHNLLRKYNEDPNEKTPLGIAVFGSPGSGKSYGIKQVASSIFEDAKEGVLKLVECNLAQFQEPNELYEKLLEARNVSRSGGCTMILLDEFDVGFEDQDFGWCKYLLSVLQDGTFRVSNIVYDIGKAFIVCAGGLNESFSAFELKSKTDKSIKVKLPDFIGRLRGHVNIKGPNPYFPYPWDETTKDKLRELNKKLPNDNKLSIFDGTRNEHFWDEETLYKLAREGQKIFDEEDIPQLDPLYKIRRAVLLRNILKRKMPFVYHESTRKIAISRKVLRALLNIPEYKYGARSMEAVIDMCVAISHDSSVFTRAMLPPPGQLDMHIDSAKFYDLIKKADQDDSAD